MNFLALQGNHTRRWRTSTSPPPPRPSGSEPVRATPVGSGKRNARVASLEVRSGRLLGLVGRIRLGPIPPCHRGLRHPRTGARVAPPPRRHHKLPRRCIPRTHHPSQRHRVDVRLWVSPAPGGRLGNVFRYSAFPQEWQRRVRRHLHQADAVHLPHLGDDVTSVALPDREHADLAYLLSVARLPRPGVKAETFRMA